MSKDYLCKNCEYNNNGWCTKRKMQGLKSVTKCSEMDKKLYPEPSNSFNLPKASTLERIEETENLLGKREMLWIIQKQILAIDSSGEENYESKYKSLVSCIISLGVSQDQMENLFKLDNMIESEVDAAMIDDSRHITKELRNEYTK